jgi:antibiotic biosynthesis monooxygenase (ABM) superfamily enzyme
MKRLILICFVVLMGYTAYEYAHQLYQDWYYHELMKQAENTLAIISVSPEKGVEVVVDNETDWATIAKLISTVLATYLGVKIINKYVH